MLQQCRLFREFPFASGYIIVQIKFNWFVFIFPFLKSIFYVYLKKAKNGP